MFFSSSDLGGPMHELVVTTSGVNGHSLLNNLQYFHVANGLLSHIMHNVFTGHIPAIIKTTEEKKMF